MIAVGSVVANARVVRHSRAGQVRLARLDLCAAPQKQRRVRPWMPAKKPSKFQAGIAGRAEHRGFKFGRHQIFLKSPRSLRFPYSNFFVEAYLSIAMHKYSYSVN